MNRSRTRSLLIGGAASAVLGRVGVGLAARRIRSHANAELDGLFAIPDATHHHLTMRDGARIHLAEVGPAAGPVVLLMHGVTLQWWVWSALMQLLAPTHRVFAWDMRGHGESTVGSEGMNLDAVGADIAEVLRVLDLSEVTAIGHSMGGMGLGNCAAAEFHGESARLGHLVFLATSGRSVGFGPIVGGMVSASKYSRWTTRFSGGIKWRPGDLSTVLVGAAFGPGATAKMIESVRLMLAEMDPSTLTDSVAAIVDHDVLERLGEVAVRSTVVVGTHDRLTPIVHARALLKAIPGSELVTLGGIGHQVMQEDPHALVEVIG